MALWCAAGNRTRSGGTLIRNVTRSEGAASRRAKIDQSRIHEAAPR